MAQVGLEDKPLKELSTSEGNILDNEELIMTLDKTKGEAEDIKVGVLDQLFIVVLLMFYAHIQRPTDIIDIAS